MYYLLKRGVMYLDQWDQPNDTSIQNLWYTAVVGDHLWGMIEGERLRVSRFLLVHSLFKHLMAVQQANWNEQCFDNLQKEFADMKKDVDAALNEHKRSIAQDFGGVAQDFTVIRKEVAELRSKTTRLQARLSRHRTDIDCNQDGVDSVEASFSDLETVLRVSEQNLALALRGRCRGTDKALEDLEPSFVDD